MATINYAAREISVKIVYYGPGLSGKTTNLQIIHRKTPKDTRSDMVSLATETDRTLFFDFLPIDLGKIRGFTTKFQLYTVPGQIYYNATRKLVLRGVDGIVFVADSDREKMAENLESYANMEENLAEYGYTRDTIPTILQYNKRDLPSVFTTDELNAQLNKYNLPWTEAVSFKGTGVFETLKLIGKQVIDQLNKKYTSPNRRRRGATTVPNAAIDTPVQQVPVPAPQQPTPSQTQAIPTQPQQQFQKATIADPFAQQQQIPPQTQAIPVQPQQQFQQPAISDPFTQQQPVPQEQIPTPQVTAHVQPQQPIMDNPFAAPQQQFQQSEIQKQIPPQTQAIPVQPQQPKMDDPFATPQQQFQQSETQEQIPPQTQAIPAQPPLDPFANPTYSQQEIQQPVIEQAPNQSKQISTEPDAVSPPPLMMMDDSPIKAPVQQNAPINNPPTDINTLDMEPLDSATINFEQPSIQSTSDEIDLEAHMIKDQPMPPPQQRFPQTPSGTEPLYFTSVDTNRQKKAKKPVINPKLKGKSGLFTNLFNKDKPQ